MSLWARLTMIINSLCFGWLVLGRLGRANRSESSGLTFETDPAMQAGIDRIVLVYFAIVFVVTLIGIFKLSFTKVAAGLALPFYIFMTLMMSYIAFIYQGEELTNLTGPIRVFFGIFAFLLLGLTALCIKTIRVPKTPNPADEFE